MSVHHFSGSCVEVVFRLFLLRTKGNKKEMKILFKKKKKIKKRMFRKYYNAVWAFAIFLESVFKFFSDSFHSEQNEMEKK